MKKCFIVTILPILLLLFLLFNGCNTADSKKIQNAAPVFNQNVTVGSLTTLGKFNSIAVRGYGVVAGLAGTGSPECPPALRDELERYIQKQLPQTKAFNAKQFLNSSNTAVVEVVGTIPAMASTGETFDVQIIPFSRSQTLSLDGGQLYTTELKESSRFSRYDQYSKTMAEAHGQVFRDPFTTAGQDPNHYLLGGGVVKNPLKISLAINQPDFTTASLIRNQVNERFGSNTASSVSSSEIQITIPRNYQHNKLRFLELIQTLYLSEDLEKRRERVAALTAGLQKESNKYPFEVALEGIGRPALDGLLPLLSSEDASVQFHAARSVLHIGDNRAIPVLNRIAQQPDHPHRIAAIESFSAAMNNKQAENALVQLLADSDLNVRLAACDVLARMNSFTIKRTIVADSFIVDQVMCAGPKMVYVSRQESPRIILFGSPIRCMGNVFCQAQDQGITLNAKAEDKYIAVSRRHPLRPRTIGPVQSSRELSSLVQMLGEDSEIKDRAVQPGLSIPYVEIVSLLKKLCDNGIIPAEFHVGPLTVVKREL